MVLSCHSLSRTRLPVSVVDGAVVVVVVVDVNTVVVGEGVVVAAGFD